MRYCTRETKFVVVLSVFLIALQPLLHIRKVGIFLRSWNPLAGVLANLEFQNYETQVQDAENYFRSLDMQSAVPIQQHNANEEIDIVVCIITVRRGRTADAARYLMQTAASMHRAIKSDTYFKNNILLVCNADSDPESHRDATYLQKHAHYVDETGDTNFGVDLFSKVTRIVRDETKYKIRRKETEDYVFCLNVTQHFNPKYVLMLEDDISPHSDLFRVLNHTVKNYGRYRYKGSDNTDCKRNEIDHLQLYYIDHLSNAQGYIISVLKNCSLCVIGGCAFLYFSTLIYANAKRMFRVKMFSRGVLITCILVLVLKNDFYLELFRFSPQMYTIMPLPRSSSVAMYYRSSIIPDLMNHLLYNVTGSGLETYKDVAINDYIYSSGLNGYLLKPYLVEHIGLISTRDV